MRQQICIENSDGNRYTGTCGWGKILILFDRYKYKVKWVFLLHENIWYIHDWFILTYRCSSPNCRWLPSKFSVRRNRSNPLTVTTQAAEVIDFYIISLFSLLSFSFLSWISQKLGEYIIFYSSEFLLSYYIITCKTHIFDFISQIVVISHGFLLAGHEMELKWALFNPCQITFLSHFWYHCPNQGSETARAEGVQVCICIFSRWPMRAEVFWSQPNRADHQSPRRQPDHQIWDQHWSEFSSVQSAWLRNQLGGWKPGRLSVLLQSESTCPPILLQSESIWSGSSFSSWGDAGWKGKWKKLARNDRQS